VAHGGLAVARRRGGSEPFAAQWMKFLRAGLGNAFTQKTNSIVGSETLALARMIAGVSYASQKLVKNSLPGTSDDALYQWALRLGISIRPDSTTTDIRAATAAKYRSPSGATRENVNESIGTLLGDILTRVTRYFGDEESIYPEVEGSFWSAGATLYGSDELALDDDGLFCSPIGTLLIEVTPPASMLNTDGSVTNELLVLMNVRLGELLDGLLPAWMNWDWVVAESSDGFILDIDHLDITAMTTDP